MDHFDLTPLYDLTAPVVTVYLALAAEQPDAANRIEIAWKDLLRELVDREVDPATVEAIAAAQPGPQPGAVTLLLVAAAGQVHLNSQLPAPPIRPGLFVGPLPHLLPLFAWRATRRAHVVVLADRVGAEVAAYPAGGVPPVRDITSDTAEWPVHKTGTGGWAAKRFDASVEESWARSAKRVAALVDEAAQAVNPALVIGSGDDRAISLLRDELPERLRSEFVVVAGGGRHADGSQDLVAQRVAEAVAEKVATDEQEMLARYAEAAGRGQGAAEGVADVVAALQQGQVGTLIVTDALAEQDTVLCFGPAPIELAKSESGLADLGIEHVSSGPAVDVVLRAATGSGAEVVVVDRHVEGAPAAGIGALLRFDPAAVTTDTV